MPCEPAEPPASNPAPAPEPESQPAAKQENEIFVQVGAFGDRTNAERRRSALLSGGIGDAFIFADEASTPPIYRVRIGPIAGVDDYDALVMKLEGLGITDPYLVTL